MTENNVSNRVPNNMDMVVVIDKEKLPEDVRKLLEENLPKDIQEKVLKMLGRPPPVSDKKIQSKLENSTPDNNKLFAIQTGTVVGNIYTDGIYKKEEDYHIKNKDIKDLGGCC